ncbi:MAG: hypothetical protein LC776_11195 [Acidobacteria bacterium]|nr:hypothetical protein [Acidobacteriota bacterium]
MDHQLQELARLGLELERFDLRIHWIPFWRQIFDEWYIRCRPDSTSPGAASKSGVNLHCWLAHDGCLAACEVAVQ